MRSWLRHMRDVISYDEQRYIVLFGFCPCPAIARGTGCESGVRRELTKALEMALHYVHVLNGPNLNLLGTREPHIYGHTTLAEIEQRCRETCSRLGLGLTFRQTNPEGYSFTSVALLDALKASGLPVVEVHITNIHRREPMYHKSLVSLTALGVICGVGPLGYELALTAVAQHV